MFLSYVDLFFKIKVFTHTNLTIRVPNSLDPDQAQQIVGPYLGPNCFQKLSSMKLNTVKR